MLYATSSARDILLGPLSCVIHHTLPVLVSPPRRNTELMGNPKIGNVCVLVNLQCVRGSNSIVCHTFSPLYDDVSQNPFGHLTGTYVDLV